MTIAPYYPLVSSQLGLLDGLNILPPSLRLAVSPCRSSPAAAIHQLPAPPAHVALSTQAENIRIRGRNPKRNNIFLSQSALSHELRK